MSGMRIPALLLVLLVPALLFGGETKTETPKLEILSPAGAGRAALRRLPLRRRTAPTSACAPQM